MSRRARSPIAPLLTLCGALAVGVGALLVVFFQGPDPQGVDVERVGSPMDAHRDSSAADGPPDAASEGRQVDVEVHAARDERAALERGFSVEVARDSGVDSPSPGELEVVVRANDRAAVGHVALQRINTNDLATPFDRSLTIEAPLVDGVARFGGLPRGVLLVGVHVGSGPPLRTTWVNSRVRGGRLEFDLGDARIHGWVRDDEGAAAAGARVRLTGRQGTVVAISAPDGSYDGGHVLPAGRWVVHVEGHPIALSSPRRSIDLQRGSVREVSFGPGGDCARWTGRLLAPDGSFVTATDGLPAKAVQLVAREGRGPAIDVRVVGGAIDQWFERDVYRLRVAGAGAPQHSARLDDLLARSSGLGRQSAPDTLDLSTDQVRDVQLAGFVLIGRVENSGSETTGLDSHFVELRSGPESESLQAEVGPDGTFRFVALEQGTYELRSWEAMETQVVIDEYGPTVVEVEIAPN
jgi:hypothetical protein